MDFMLVGLPLKSEWHHQLVRRVKVVHGSMKFSLQCHPAFDYTRATHRTTLTKDGVRFDSRDLSLSLAISIPVKPNKDRVEAEFVLEEGQTATFVLRRIVPEGDGRCPSADEKEELFERTVQYWNRWLSKCSYAGRWREMVYRSALILKLLTFEPTGAIVTAPTCSLPESLGGGRNWDYRYTWLRDAAFTLYGLLRIGFTEEANAFMDWLEARPCRLQPRSGAGAEAIISAEPHCAAQGVENVSIK